MQVSPVGRTSFGLKIDPDMQELLDRSRQAAIMKGPAEYNSFVTAEEKMKTLADDKYELYVDTYGEVKLETPRHGIWHILDLQGEKDVLTTSNITNGIMFVIRRAKQHERERHILI